MSLAIIHWLFIDHLLSNLGFPSRCNNFLNLSISLTHSTDSTISQLLSSLLTFDKYRSPKRPLKAYGNLLLLSSTSTFGEYFPDFARPLPGDSFSPSPLLYPSVLLLYSSGASPEVIFSLPTMENILLASLLTGLSKILSFLL